MNVSNGLARTMGAIESYASQKPISLLCIDSDEATHQSFDMYAASEKLRLSFAHNESDGYAAYVLGSHDIILIAHTPTFDGIALARKIRAFHGKNPMIVFLSYTDDVDTLLAAIDVRATDFITRPLTREKAVTLIHEIVPYVSQTRIIHIGNICIDFERMELRRANQRISLTHKEAKLLRLLVDATPNAVTYERLRGELCHNGGEDNCLKALLYRLRIKMGKDVIKTLNATGLILTKPVS